LKIRGYATLSLAAVFFSVSDLFQRLVVCPIARMLPASGPMIYGKWQRLLSRTLFMILRTFGGADIPRPDRVPGGPGVLILMNHQSILDIPMAIASVEGGFPRIVTRERYAKWIPVISHTIRTLEYPVVNPRAKTGTIRRHLDRLEQVARTGDAPLVLFPEGTRTRNGKIGRFQTAGLERILRAREWRVYVLVSDGYWRHAKLKQFVGGIRELKGQLSVLGPFEWKDPEADPEDFIARMRGVMVDELARVRGVEPDLVPPAAQAPNSAPDPIPDPIPDPAPA
jgi:1-acyl-sn-glycerol-3-phosphate acyltransferase